MKTTALLMISIIAAVAPVAGCNPSSSDVAASVAALKGCPPDGCAPPDPGDGNPPPKPPKPPQPDPAKYRTAYLQTDDIRRMLDVFLADTRIAITNTGGDAISIPLKGKSCTTTGNTPEEQKACEDDCNHDTTLTPAQKAQCRAGCASKTTCVDVCGAYSTSSFVQWGEVARYASQQKSPKKCDATTCPACATLTWVASLDDTPLSIAPFTQSYGVGPASVDVTCSINRWMFQVRNNLKVESTPDALYITVPGTTGSPAVDCTNAPDPTVDGLGLTLRFSFPWSQFTVVTDASLAGDWHVLGSVIDFLADMNGRISDAVAGGTHEMLNTQPMQKTFWGAFANLTEQYVNDNTGETFDKMGYIESQYGQLKVTYWVK